MKAFEEIAKKAVLQIMLEARKDGYEPMPHASKYFAADMDYLESLISEWLVLHFEREDA